MIFLLTLAAFARAPSLDAVFADNVEGVCDVASVSPLVPLHGPDHQGIPAAAGAPPKWEDAEPREVSWERVATVRREVFLGAPSAARLYELGALHRELGHAREAAHYFGGAAEADPTGISALQRADALRTLGAWDDARAALADAARLGAAPHDVLVGLGAVSLASGSPGPAAVGRALSAEGPGPDDALAGALLVRAGCWSEAVAPLARATRGGASPWARLLLADAHLLAGDTDAAGSVLADLSTTDVASDAPSPGLVRARRMLLALVGQPPSGWPSMVPSLTRIASTGDEAEAREALFVLAQIGAHLGEDDLAVEALTALVDRDERLLAGEPGARLADAWARRTGAYLAEGHDVDALATHLEAWRPGLEQHVEPGALSGIAAAWRRLGLHDEALDTLGAVATVEARDARDDRATVLALAAAYHRTGRLAEALETLDFLATRHRDPTFDARAALLRGRILLDRGDAEGAHGAWRLITAPEAEAAEARLRIALHDAEGGRCEGVDALGGAGMALGGAATEGLPPDLAPGRVAAAHVACLAAVGRAAEARDAAVQADGTLIDAGTRTWVASVGGVRAEGPWARLAAEEEAHAALLARLRGRSGSSSSGAAAPASSPATAKAPVMAAGASAPSAPRVTTTSGANPATAPVPSPTPSGAP